jgi:hypothetical protein
MLRLLRERAVVPKGRGFLWRRGRLDFREDDEWLALLVEDHMLLEPFSEVVFVLLAKRPTGSSCCCETAREVA